MPPRLPAIAAAWQSVDHHRAHAAYAFYDSPFTEALVLTMDGIGNDGSFLIWRGSRAAGLTRLKSVPVSFGAWYRFFAEAAFAGEYEVCGRVAAAEAGPVPCPEVCGLAMSLGHGNWAAGPRHGPLP